MKNTRTATVDLLLVPGLLAILLLGAGLQNQKPNPGAAATGKDIFKTYCGACHGASGKGDGPIADDLRTSPGDLTRISEENAGQFPFDEVRKKIDGREKVKGHGSKDMPAWGDAFTATETEEAAQQRIDDITHFLWSIQVVASD